jgi:HlyD family secretion protein
MNKKILVALIVLLAAVVLGLGLSLRRHGQKQPRFRTEVTSVGDVTATVVTSGTLTPVSVVEVGSQLSGTITKINADFNSRVRKGEVLAELDPVPFQKIVDRNEANYRSAQAALEKAQISLELAKNKFDRFSELFRKKIISLEDEEDSEADYLNAKDDVLLAQAAARNAKDTLEVSRINLQYASIRSPIDGVVLSRNVSVGQTVAAKMQAPVLFTIANNVRAMMVDCDVDETDIGRVKEGQPVRFTVSAYPMTTFTGQVAQIRIGSDMTQNVVTYSTLVEVNETGGRLLPGMTAIVTIITAEAKNVLRVLNSALRFEPSLPTPPSPTPVKKGGAKAKRAARPPSPHVWVRKPDGSLVTVSIETGISDNVYTEIVSGDLRQGDMVIDGLSYAQPNISSPGASRTLFRLFRSPRGR